jgi:hypothetical protein
MLADLVLVAILLVNALLGLKRGFFEMIGRLFLLALSLAVTLLLLSPLTGLLAKLPVLEPLATKLGDRIIAPLEKTAASVGEAVASLHLPAFLADLMQSKLPAATTGISGAHSELSAAVFHFALSVAVFVILFILVILLVHLAARALTRVTDAVPVIGTLNRIAGLAVGLVLGLCEAAIILLLVGFAAPCLPQVAAAVAQSRIAGYFYAMNVLQYLLQL